jgi:hypothetical protein
MSRGAVQRVHLATGKIARHVPHDLAAVVAISRYVHLEVKVPVLSVLGINVQAVFRVVTIPAMAAQPGNHASIRSVKKLTLPISALSGSAELLVQSTKTNRRARPSQMKLLRKTLS